MEEYALIKNGNKVMLQHNGNLEYGYNKIRDFAQSANIDFSIQGCIYEGHFLIHEIKSINNNLLIGEEKELYTTMFADLCRWKNITNPICMLSEFILCDFCYVFPCQCQRKTLRIPVKFLSYTACLELAQECCYFNEDVLVELLQCDENIRKAVYANTNHMPTLRKAIVFHLTDGQETLEAAIGATHNIYVSSDILSSLFNKINSAIENGQLTIAAIHEDLLDLIVHPETEEEILHKLLYVLGDDMSLDLAKSFLDSNLSIANKVAFIDGLPKHFREDVECRKIIQAIEMSKNL